MTTIALDPGGGFREATDYARKRKIVLPYDYYGRLQGEARAKAWSVAGIASLQQLQEVFRGLNQIIEEGGTFADFKRKVRSGEIPLDLPDHRLETIFRTNVQAAYGRGRAEQQARASRRRPFLMYDAINDSRTRPAHSAMDGFIARHDDPIWSIWRPPAGYNCRCTVISLTEEQARARGYGQQRRPDVQPDEGWDYNRAAGIKVDEGLKRAERRAKAQAPEKVAQAHEQNIEPKAKGLLFELKKTPEKIGDLEDVLRIWSRRNKGDLQAGDFVRVRFRDVDAPEEYFAATNCFGEYWLNDAPVPGVPGFSAFDDLMDAMGKIRAGQPLTFNQEYAVEVLWHEINHNRQKWIDPLTRRPAELTTNQRAVMETVNQWVSRETYPRFLRDLGAEPLHFDDIKARGFGYGRNVANLNALIEKLGIDREAFLQRAEAINFSTRIDRFPQALTAEIVDLAAPWATADQKDDLFTDLRLLFSALEQRGESWGRDIEYFADRIRQMKGSA